MNSGSGGSNCGCIIKTSLYSSGGSYTLPTSVGYTMYMLSSTESTSFSYYDCDKVASGSTINLTHYTYDEKTTLLYWKIS